MKKLLLTFFIIICLMTLHQAKRSHQYNHDQDSQIQQNNYRPSKSTKKHNKDYHPYKDKKLKKHMKPNPKHNSDQHQILHWNQFAFWCNAILALFLSCAGGFFSGMTVGLNSLDKLTLEVQKITGSEQQKSQATRILNTIKDHHLFLVTLLIANAMVLEYLPLVMHKLMPDWAAILMSTFVVVIVAEIAPMSYTTGPSKYKVAYICAPLVDLCVKVYYVVAYPIARGLDRLLGVHDDTHIKRRDFLAFINEKKKNHLKPLELTMFNKLFVGPIFTSVQNFMIPINQVMVLSMNDEVTQQLTDRIFQSDISYIFIAQNSQDVKNFNILSPIDTKTFVLSYLRKQKQMKKSLLKIKDLILPQFAINPKNIAQTSLQIIKNKQAVLKNNQKHRIPVIYSDTGLLDCIEIMKFKNCSVSLVHKDKRRNSQTDIAYLDARDHEVVYDSISVRDKHNIVGVVTIQNVYQNIVDFHNEIFPKFLMQKQVSPVKKRKLVKKASIVSAYSASSSRSFVQ